MTRRRPFPLGRRAAVLLVLLALLPALALGGRLAVEPYRVAGASMTPALTDGELLLVDRLAYLRSAPDRGDVVVFAVSQPRPATFVKRVVALAGETVEIRDGALTVDGAPLAEPYLAAGTRTGCGGPTCALTVPAGHVYVLGDNRDFSADSRVFGPVPLDTIVGEAVELSWPDLRP